MVEIVWECLVKEEAQGTFNLVFGPGGAWSRLFAGRSGYRGTTVLSDLQNSKRYLIIDLWDSTAAREPVFDSQKDAYTALLVHLQNSCEVITTLGTFRVRSEATVRPKLRPKTSRP